jgi:hypothetical protein
VTVNLLLHMRRLKSPQCNASEALKPPRCGCHLRRCHRRKRSSPHQHPLRPSVSYSALGARPFRRRSADPATNHRRSCRVWAGHLGASAAALTPATSVHRAHRAHVRLLRPRRCCVCCVCTVIIVATSTHTQHARVGALCCPQGQQMSVAPEAVMNAPFMVISASAAVPPPGGSQWGRKRASDTISILRHWPVSLSLAVLERPGWRAHAWPVRGVD